MEVAWLAGPRSRRSRCPTRPGRKPVDIRTTTKNKILRIVALLDKIIKMPYAIKTKHQQKRKFNESSSIVTLEG